MNKIKEAFIDDYDRAIAPGTLPRIFAVAEKLEDFYGKDCCNFVLEEITMLMMSFGSSDLWTLRQKASLLRTYTAYCIDRGFSTDGINHYLELSTEILDSCVDKKKVRMRYVTTDDLENILSQLKNPRDKVLILAPYEGISGKENCELCNLTIDDLLPQNMVHIAGGRTIEVSERLWTLMKMAHNMTVEETGRGAFPLNNTKHIIKSQARSCRPHMVADSIKGRIAVLKRQLGLPHLGVKMLRNSGFYEAFDVIYQKFGESYEKTLASKEYQKLCEHYNVFFKPMKIYQDHGELREIKG